jgi:nitrite reductase (NADH) large subunit
MERMKLVMVGNGMAGVRTLEELLKIAPGLYDITVFGAEPHANYNRILLSPVLAGEMTLKDIMLNDVDWYEKHGITLHLNRKVTTIDRRASTVIAADGTAERYDRLLLATGSNPFILPIPGKELRGVLTYRDIQDTNAMIDAAAQYKRAAVIGGGLLGLEAANGLKLRGMDVTVVHLMEWLMERQLDRTAAGMLQKSLEEKGLKFLMRRQTTAILGTADGRAKGVRFADGEEIGADLVVMAIGIRPNDELARSAGIHCNRGIVVSDTMQTFDPRIYAVGECVSHRGTAYGLVAPLFEMAKVCANHLAHMGIGRYEGSVTSTKLKVTGIDLFSAGNFTGSADTEEIVLHDAVGGIYKRLVLKDDRIVGGVLYGDTVDGSWYFQMLREKHNVAEIRDHLMFGQSQLGNTGHQGQSRAAAMADTMEVCGCNGVCKGTIVKAIKEKGLFTLEDVRKYTKASSSCGSCTGLVEQILASTVGGAYAPQLNRNKPMCGCTDYTHEEVRQAIRERHLLAIPGVMQFMEWRTPNGCASCRPALNYYLISTWPHEAQDDPQSRFINERAHANIQKDGTYSVVPRMFGGVTTSAQLRRIADVVDKYQVPTVKVTGGQRIDLLGVKKEDLPAVWADLNAAGMVSGAAYAKGLRTVKTCVGSDWCRFGTQDSTGLGIRIEKFMWGAWTPAKLKLAVSGCPRNCAEATCKDIGVICVDSGYDIHFAGAAGLDIKGTELLCHADSEDEALEIIVALTQLYREQGRYLERIYKWAKRVGTPSIKANVVDDLAKRRHYFERFVYSQTFAQVDPWEERVNGKDAHEFAAMAEFGMPVAAE